MSLYESLKKYGDSEMYPYHMPGHKRHPEEYLPESFACIDITEIEGFDNLHNAEGIIKEAQDFAADIIGAEHTYFLVGGSTAGVLSAISAAVPKGGTLLMARNAHRSAYNAVGLMGIDSKYIFPDINKEFGFCEAVTPEKVKEALDKYPEAEAVFIVSPTYEGKIADVQSIAEIVHSKGIPLIVDEAHGAHLSFFERTDGYGISAVRSGADIVIQSVHKTLPAPTQTALIHLNGDLVDRRKLERYLKIYQSSSPSYPLMAGIDGCVRTMAAGGREKLLGFADRFKELVSYINENCTYISALSFEPGTTDVGKLIISAKAANIYGSELAEALRKRFRLETEMSSEWYVLAMFTVSDGFDGYDRLKKALTLLDREYGVKCADSKRGVVNSCRDADDPSDCFDDVTKVYTISESWEMPAEETNIENAASKISAEFVNVYPPGTPILVPGEEIGDKHIALIERYLKEGLNVIGVKGGRLSTIKR